MFKDILTLLGLEYRDAVFITLYFVVSEISIPKIRSIGVAALSKSYLTTIGITMQSLKSIGQF